MKNCYLKKWYFDILTPDNELIYFYLTNIKFFNWSSTLFNLHYINEEQHLSISKKIENKTIRTIENDKVIFVDGCVQFINEVFLINYESSDLKINLIYKDLYSNKASLSQQFIHYKRSKIDWYPIINSGLACGNLIINDNQIMINGYKGYADFIHSTIFPFKMPISILHWGRMHHDKIDLSYSIAYNSSKKLYWSKMIARLEQKIIEFNNIDIDITKEKYFDKLNIHCPDICLLKAKNDKIEINLEINNEKVFRDTHYIDEYKDIQKAYFKVIKYSLKNICGIKFLSKAKISANIKEFETIEDVKGIGEIIKFK